MNNINKNKTITKWYLTSSSKRLTDFEVSNLYRWIEEHNLYTIDALLTRILQQVHWDEITITNKNSDTNLPNKYEYTLNIWYFGENEEVISGTGYTILEAKEDMIYKYAYKWLEDNTIKNKKEKV